MEIKKELNAKQNIKVKKKIHIRPATLIISTIGILISLLYLSPFYIMIINSFKSKRDIFESTTDLPKQWLFSNYKDAFTRLDFLKTLSNSLIITILSIVVIVVFASMAAWMLQRTKSKISTIVFFIFISAMLVPFQSVMLPLIRIMGKMSLLNRGGLIFMYLGFGAPMAIFLYHGFVKGIPKELDEAAMIDGCNKFKTFWYIIFPLLKPITITVSILNVVWIWNDFLLPNLVINDVSKQTIPLKTYLFFGEYTKQWHLALAGLVLTIIPVIIFYFTAQKHIVKSITAGSVKS